jgi:hypothetical protein
MSAQFLPRRSLAVETLEDRTQPAAIQPLKVALISDAVAQAGQVRAAAATGVTALVYDADTASLDTLVGMLREVSAAHGGVRIDRLGLVGHGSAGAVHIGTSSEIDAASVAADSPAWAGLRDLLAPAARLDLYACNVAADGGRAFVDALADRTGAAVYASTDAVGTAPGADLVWEYRTARRDAPPLFNLGKLAAVDGLVLDDAFEENDSIAVTAAQPAGGVDSPNFGPVVGGKTIGAAMEDENDFYRFTTLGPATHLHYVSIAHSLAAANIDLRLYDAAGGLIDVSESPFDTDTISLKGFPSGTYYVRAYPQVAGVLGAAYDLRIEAPLDTGDDVYEPNNSIPEVAAKPAGAPGSPNLGTVAGSLSLVNLVQDDSSRQDYFRFVTTAAGNTQHYVSIGFNASDGNLDLRLYDGVGTLLESSESPFDTDTISLNGLPAGTYYVRAYAQTIERPAMASYDLQIRTPGSSLSFDATTIVPEGDAGLVDVQFTFTRSDGAGSASVAYATANGTATAGADYTAATGTLTFNGGELTKTVTVQVHGDVIDEPDETFFLNLSNPVGVTLRDTRVVATVADDDEAEVIVTPSGGETQVVEGGAPDTYSVRLATQPVADVTVTLTPGSQLAASAPTLTFTSANWFQAQLVTVTAIDDPVAEGTHGAVVTHLATSSDAAYNGLAVADLPVTVTDNDIAAVLAIEGGGNTTVSEAGADDVYSLVLLSRPTADVIVRPATTLQLDVLPPLVTFTPANWNVPQPIAVGAVDDDDDEGIHVAAITHSVTSADGTYHQIAVDSVNATILDNDTAPALVIVETGATTGVTEGGPGDTVSIRLATPPTADVVVSPAPGSQLTASVALTFTPANWNAVQTITVGAVDDAIAEGTHLANLTLTSTSADINYGSLPAIGLPVTITDNDRAGVLVVESGGATGVTEGGAGDSYTIALAAQPSADVTVTLLSSTQLQVSPPTVTFTAANWNVPHVIDVAAVNDAVDQGTRVVSIAHSAASPEDQYDGLPVVDVDVVITDNDANPTAGFDGFAVAEDGGPTALQVLANDTGSQTSISAVTQGANGTVVITAGGAGLTYEPDPGFSGTDLFTYTIADVNGVTATAGVLVSVSPVNDAPELTLPGPQTIRANTPATIHGVFVNDPDALHGSGLIEVSLSVRNGTLTLPTTAGLTFAAGDGTTDAAMTLTGSLSNVAAAVSTLTYRPNPDTLVPDTLTIDVDDLGNAGSGGPQVVSGSVPLDPLAGQVLPQPNPTSTTLTDLVVYGTADADEISVTGKGTTFQVTGVGASAVTMKKVTGRVLLFGLGGDDRLLMSKVARAGVLDGGAGNDTVGGGTKNDRLTGGPGDDRLDGGKGLDRLVEAGTSFVLAQGTLSGLGADVLVNNSIEEADLTGDDGNDVIDASAFSGKTWLFGGGGDDVLRAGAAGGVLLGGAGADQLVGAAGRDVLIGGLGLDTVNGGDGEDILIGGTTIHDADRPALDRIAAEWSRTKGTYAVRINHLLGPAGGLNKTTFLSPATVIHDGLANSLTGGQDLDWFLEKTGVDITNAETAETRTSL